MVNIGHGQISKQAYLKDQFLVLYFFLIYINHLPNGLNSNAKLFADDTSLFSVVHNITDSANLLNSWSL